MFLKHSFSPTAPTTEKPLHPIINNLNVCHVCPPFCLMKMESKFSIFTFFLFDLFFIAHSLKLICKMQLTCRNSK